MEFLQTVLRRHLAGKPVVASWNVGCFSDYQYTLHTNFFSLCRNLKNVLFKLSVGTKICVFAPTLCQFQRQSWRKSISTKNGIISRKAKYACLQAITSMKFGDYGKYRFRWNAIVSSWLSNELKTARLSIPYYHSPFTPPAPPLRGTRPHARSCFSFVLLQPAFQNFSFPIPLSLQGTERKRFRYYSRLSLNGHLYKTDTSLKRTLRVDPWLSLLPLFDSL